MTNQKEFCANIECDFNFYEVRYPEQSDITVTTAKNNIPVTRQRKSFSQSRNKSKIYFCDVCANAVTMATGIPGISS